MMPGSPPVPSVMRWPAPPTSVARKAQGSPIAAGLIAFGLPTNRVEQQAAEAVKDTAQPLVDDLTDTAKEVVENPKEPAQQAKKEVKLTTTDAVDTAREDATNAATDVKDHVTDAKNTAQQAAR
jgi:hypothetical protein